MKSLILATALFAAMPTFAHQTYNELFDSIMEISLKEGLKGTYTKNGKVVARNKPCVMSLEDIDSWSSDGTVTADLLQFYVAGKDMGTDLETWELTTERTLTSGAVKYSHNFDGRNCKYSNELTVLKGKSVTLMVAKQCRNGVKTRDSISCSI